jgi:hypothetical protein
MNDIIAGLKCVSQRSSSCTHARARALACAFKYFRRETPGLSFVVSTVCDFKCETSDMEIRMKHCFRNLYLYVFTTVFYIY